MSPSERGFQQFFGQLLGGQDYYSRKKCLKIRNYGNACGYDLRTHEVCLLLNDFFLTSLFIINSSLILRSVRKAPIYLKVFINRYGSLIYLA